MADAPRRIQPLASATIDRIAAGEVVERPASVVKELVENALDAGATRVAVDIEEGGRGLIRVTDDGGGVAPDDLPLAVARHATSKLRDDRELEAVATMGFRGEALASIASVSRFRLLSRRPTDDAAHEVEVIGGQIGPVRPAAGNVGTSVEVRDLFYNVPARRKFLKSAQAESAAVTEMLTRLALPRPDVAFSYSRDNRPIFDWPAGGDPLDRLLMAWPSEYRGRSITIDAADGDWRLTGVVGLPEYAATSGRYQHVYVNKRAIIDRSLSHALREAFRGLTEPGRHPAAVLMLSLPAGAVDVNVHPTKREVRFREAGRAWHLVQASVREALLARDLAPVARPRVADETPREDVRETLANFFRGAKEAGAKEVGGGQTPEPEPTPEPDSDLGPPPASPAPTSPSGLRALQVHDSYLVVQSDDGVEIIDQHALHERVLFEELLARVRRGPLEAQRLLMPSVADADAEMLEKLDALAPTLARLGVEAEPFGPDAVAVHSFPSFLLSRGVGEDAAAFVAGVLERAGEVRGDGDDEAILHDVLDLMACKAAVKAGDRLSPEEVDALIARRGLTPRRSNCPHGRPTTLKLSLSDLEKQFKRTGF